MERYSTVEERQAIQALYTDRERRQTSSMNRSSTSHESSHYPYNQTSQQPSNTASQIPLPTASTISHSETDEHGPFSMTTGRATGDVHKARPIPSGQPHRHAPQLHRCTCNECTQRYLTHTPRELERSASGNYGERNDMQGVGSAPNTQHSENGDPEDPIRKGWRMYIHNFSTPWFTINMGTGLLSYVHLHNIFYLIFRTLADINQDPALPHPTSL